MIRVNVNPALISWALDRVPNLVEIHRKFPKISEWISGTTKPTLRQLEEFSKATRTPFGYFFLSEVPDEVLPIPLFRTTRDSPVRRSSTDLLELVRIMQRRQAWMREYLVNRGDSPLPFVGIFWPSTPTEEVARAIRNILGLQEDWARGQPNWTAALRELQGKVEEAGIIVAASSIVGNNPHRQLDPDEFRGFVLVDEYAPLVFINSADFKAAQMFTLAHELAHIWLGTSAAFDLRNMQPARNEVEEACNRVAAEFLVPAAQLRQIWSDIIRESDPFQAIARYFKVSEIVAVRRALDLKLVTKEQFLTFYEDYLNRERQAPTPREEGGYFYATQATRLGKRFGRTVVQAVQEGALLYHEAYRLTGLYGRTFERFAAYLAEALL